MTWTAELKILVWRTICIIRRNSLDPCGRFCVGVLVVDGLAITGDEIGIDIAHEARLVRFLGTQRRIDPVFALEMKRDICFHSVEDKEIYLYSHSAYFPNKCGFACARLTKFKGKLNHEVLSLWMPWSYSIYLRI